MTPNSRVTTVRTVLPISRSIGTAISRIASVTKRVAAITATTHASSSQPPPDRPPDQPAPVVWGPVGSLLGAPLVPIATTTAFLTGRRVVHPVGASFDAELEVFDPPSPLLAGTVLGTASHHPVIVRLSRGFGRPLHRRDVHGFALRIPDADGAGGDQDLLLATIRRGLLGRDATGFTERYGPTFSTMLRLRLPSGRTVVFKVRPRQQMPGDATIHSGGGGGLRFDLCVGRSPRDVRVIGVVTLGNWPSASPGPPGGSARRACSTPPARSSTRRAMSAAPSATAADPSPPTDLQRPTRSGVRHRRQRWRQRRPADRAASSAASS